VNDREADPESREVRLTGANRVAFTFSCINYSSSPTLYSYKMTGLDSTWTTVTSRTVIYQNLSRGNYVFLLRACKPTEAWSVPVECRIVIKATFWQHPLTYLMLSVMVVALLVIFIIRRKNNQLKHQETDHQLILLEQKALQSMMNPHFIFNSLGSIQNFLLQQKSGEAALYLSQFARLIRQNLNSVKEAMINLDEETDRLKNYLDLERLRMEDKFECRIDVDENIDADEILIPSMIIQPFVENSIWHGLSSFDSKGLVTICFSLHNEKSLRVIIEDNGIGIKKAQTFQMKGEQHLNLGMEMTRKRLELLGRKYVVKTWIEFSEAFPGNPNPGTKVVMILPFVYFDSGR
jgi:LytS/YehU family sensor histidine kinase